MPRIVPFPHPALWYESRPIERIDDEFQTTVRTMFDLMYENRGIGLAANQVALPFRFFILNITADREQPDKEQVFINPEIVKRHSSVEEEEGCLSLPGLYAKVRRAKKIRVKAFDLNAQEVDLEADDLLSRPSSTRLTTSQASFSSTTSDPSLESRHRARSRSSRPSIAKRVSSGSSPTTPS